MRNILFSLLLIGALLTGIVLLFKYIEKQQPTKADPGMTLRIVASTTTSKKTTNTQRPNTASTNHSLSNLSNLPDDAPSSNATTNPAGRSGSAAKATPPTSSPTQRTNMDALKNMLSLFMQQDFSVQNRNASATNNQLPEKGHAVVSVPHTPLLQKPAPGAAPVTLLYRGNSLLITGRPISNHLPCNAMGTNGYVAISAIETVQKKEADRFRTLTKRPGATNGATALRLSLHALRRRDRLALVELVFQKLTIRYSGWDTLMFEALREDLRNRPADSPLCSKPYTRSFSLNRLFRLSRRYLSGRGRISRMDGRRYQWVNTNGSRLLVVQKGKRWFLDTIYIKMHHLR